MHGRKRVVERSHVRRKTSKNLSRLSSRSILDINTYLNKVDDRAWLGLKLVTNNEDSIRGHWSEDGQTTV